MYLLYTYVYLHMKKYLQIYHLCYIFYTMMSSMVQSESGERCDAVSAAEAEHSISLYTYMLYVCTYTYIHIIHAYAYTYDHMIYSIP